MAWSRIQSASTNVGSGNPAVAYGTNVTSGTKLIAAVTLSSSDANAVALSAVVTVADGASNQLTFIGGVVVTGTGYMGLFAMDTPAGDVGTKPTLTGTVSGTVNNFGVALLIQEISGLAVGNTLAAMIDGTLAANSATSSAGPATTGAYSSTASNEYLVAVIGDPGTGATYSNPPAGYSADVHNVMSTSNANTGIQYKNSGNTSESASFTLGGSEDWYTLLVAFKLGAPVATSGPALLPVPASRVAVVAGIAGRTGAGHSL